LDVPTLGSTVSGQTPNQDPEPEFNLIEINNLDRSGGIISFRIYCLLKNGNKKG
jgi:hypothetical protein